MSPHVTGRNDKAWEAVQRGSIREEAATGSAHFLEALLHFLEVRRKDNGVLGNCRASLAAEGHPLISAP